MNQTIPAYHLQLEIELRNTDAKTRRSSRYRLDGATGMSLEGWWYAARLAAHWSGGSLRDVVVRFDGSSVRSRSRTRRLPRERRSRSRAPALAYAGVDGQYFSAVLIPQLAALDDNWFETTEAMIVGTAADVKDGDVRESDLPADAESRLNCRPATSHSDSYQVFLGPKRPELAESVLSEESRSGLAIRIIRSRT